MRIVIDLKSLAKEYFPGSNSFIKDVIAQMAHRYSEHQFFLLVFDNMEEIAGLPTNATLLRIQPPPVKWLGKGLWYRYMLAKKMRRTNAGIYIACDHLARHTSPIPTCLLIVNLNAFAEEEAFKKQARSTAGYAKAGIHRASIVITMSDYDRTLVEQHSNLQAGKARVVTLLPEGKRLNPEECELIRSRYARGLDYFVFAGDLHDRHRLPELLKAFSQFKKWQQSNMQLVIAGNKTPFTEEFANKLLRYKYREDVHLVIDPPPGSIPDIIGAAYAFVYPAFLHHYPVMLLLAMRSGVPIISSGLPVIRELAGNSIMYVDTENAGGFFRGMLSIYKDERLRESVIQSGAIQVSRHQERDGIKELWGLLSRLYNSKS